MLSLVAPLHAKGTLPGGDGPSSSPVCTGVHDRQHQHAVVMLICAICSECWAYGDQRVLSVLLRNCLVRTDDERDRKHVRRYAADGIDIILHNLLSFFSSRSRHTIFDCDWSSDVCSSD